MCWCPPRWCAPLALGAPRPAVLCAPLRVGACCASPCGGFWPRVPVPVPPRGVVAPTMNLCYESLDCLEATSTYSAMHAAFIRLFPGETPREQPPPRLRAVCRGCGTTVDYTDETSYIYVIHSRSRH